MLVQIIYAESCQLLCGTNLQFSMENAFPSMDFKYVQTVYHSIRNELLHVLKEVDG